MGFFDFLSKPDAPDPHKKKPEVQTEKEDNKISEAKASNGKVIGDLKEILIKEYLDYMKQFKDNAISKEYLNQLVLEIVMREGELKTLAAQNDLKYEEIDYVVLAENNDLKESEPEWKSYSKEKEAKREELWEKRRVLYEELKEITDNYTLGIADLALSENLIENWNDAVKELIKEYELAELPYKPIFDYWAKNTQDDDDDEYLDDDE